MKRLVIALVGLWPSLATAQQPGQQVDLRLSIPDTQLVVQTLGRVACPDVQTMETCQQAVDILKKIREQVRQQVKQ